MIGLQREICKPILIKTRFSATGHNGVPLKIFTQSTVFIHDKVQYILCIYLAYHSGIQIGTPPPPLPQRVWPPPPRNQRGGTHSPACEGVGEFQFGGRKKSLALCLLCGIHTYHPQSQILYTEQNTVYRAHSLEGLMKVHNWFLNQFVKIPRRSIIVCLLSLLAKAGFKPLTF